MDASDHLQSTGDALPVFAEVSVITASLTSIDLGSGAAVTLAEVRVVCTLGSSGFGSVFTTDRQKFENTKPKQTTATPESRKRRFLLVFSKSKDVVVWLCGF